MFVQAEFELRVGDDNTAGESVVGALVVQRKGQVAQFFHVFLAVAGEEPFHPGGAVFHGDVPVMLADRGFRARRENSFRQFLAFLEPFGQADAANRAVFLIAFPAAARDITADDAFHGNHVQFQGLHAVAGEFRFLEKFRHIVGVRRKHVVRHNVLREIEPEFAHLVEDSAFLRNWGFQNAVKSGDAVRAHHDQAVAQIVQFAYLPGFEGFVFFHLVLLSTTALNQIKAVPDM